MKITLISFHFSEYTFLLAKALSVRHEVQLILNQKNAERELGDRLNPVEGQQFEIIVLPDYGLKNPLMLFNIFNIVSRIKRFSPDVVHCQEAITDYLMAALLLLRKYPLVLTIHDHIPHSGIDSQARKRIIFYQQRLRHMPDVVIVHGDRIKNESEKLLPWLQDRIVAIPHGPLGEAPEMHDEQWESGNLLFFGRIEQYKGLRYFIDAVKVLNSENVAVKGVIAGTGRDLENYRDEIESDSQFELIDRYIDDQEIPGIFNKANVVVLPYTDATQSGVVALALRFGRPIVASEVGSIGEVVREGFNGLLVPPKDVPALADAIKKLVNNSQVTTLMAQNARVLASTELSWETIAEKTEKAYQIAIANKLGDAALLQSATGKY
ncbi:glycosyltransferase family 4 protein [Sulfurirhabdus autotrophica]|uniref:Glycosyltransferase involved in cell wall biosynthesis n=1 Tax=Sulfurirhabdus autotrophica TaxID=1706046 RepID=A0A4V2W199_9PROT|nr:glycosyltransferase family 4 protein [Sulfurirhabdus autotrophica]TCV83439.1 glycosyltransferase involved in cell wall biosynthesis [Sulfurirhabdus autotrophica]